MVIYASPVGGVSPRDSLLDAEDVGDAQLVVAFPFVIDSSSGLALSAITPRVGSPTSNEDCARARRFCPDESVGEIAIL